MAHVDDEMERKKQERKRAEDAAFCFMDTIPQPTLMVFLRLSAWEAISLSTRSTPFLPLEPGKVAQVWRGMEAERKKKPRAFDLVAAQEGRIRGRCGERQMWREATWMMQTQQMAKMISNKKITVMKTKCKRGGGKLMSIPTNDVDFPDELLDLLARQQFHVSSSSSSGSSSSRSSGSSSSSSGSSSSRSSGSSSTRSSSSTGAARAAAAKAAEATTLLTIATMAATSLTTSWLLPELKGRQQVAGNAENCQGVGGRGFYITSTGRDSWQATCHYLTGKP